MKTYELIQEGSVKQTVEAENIDQAIDRFFPQVQVDVDLNTMTHDYCDIRPLHQRKSLPAFIIRERGQ